MVAVPDDDACRAHCCSLTITVRSFAGNVRSLRGPHGRHPRSAQDEQFLHYGSNGPIETRRLFRVHPFV